MSISREEAEMWFYAITCKEGTPEVPRGQIRQWLQDREYTGNVDVKVIVDNSARLDYSVIPQYTVVLHKLLGTTALMS